MQGVKVLSEEAKLRAEIERLNQALEQSQAELKDFIYIASHDLNAPIRGISNYAQFIAEDYQDLLPEEGQMFLKRIAVLSNHLGDMIQDLVNLSRIGQLEHSDQATDFDQLAKELLQDSRNGTLAVEGSLGRFRIHPSAARSILEHLIDNGLTFNRSDEPTVTVTWDEELQGILVEDNGIGIKSEHQTDIFNPFRSLNTEEAFGKTTGLGLTLVKKVLDNADGSIQVDSAPEVGTRMTIKLPRA